MPSASPSTSTTVILLVCCCWVYCNDFPLNASISVSVQEAYISSSWTLPSLSTLHQKLSVRSAWLKLLTWTVMLWPLQNINPIETKHKTSSKQGLGLAHCHCTPGKQHNYLESVECILLPFLQHFSTIHTSVLHTALPAPSSLRLLFPKFPSQLPQPVL